MPSSLVPGSGQVDIVLSNWAKGYRNNNYIADLLFPRIPVTEQGGKYFIFGRENFRRMQNLTRAAGAPAAETRGRTTSKDSYFCESRALDYRIPDEYRKAYKIGDPNQEATRFNMDLILLDREVRALGKAFSTDTFAAANKLALAGASKWSDDDSDPVAQVEDAKTQIKLMGVQANTLVVSNDVAVRLKSHPKILARFSGVVAIGTVSNDQLAGIFGVQKFVVADAVQDTDAGTGFIVSGVALLVYVDQATISQPVGYLGVEGAILPESITFGKSFTWVNAPDAPGGYGVIIGRDPRQSAKSDIVTTDWYTDEKVAGAEVGFLFTAVL